MLQYKTVQRKPIAGIALGLLVAFGATNISAHNNPGYSHDSDIGYSNPNWMNNVPDNTTLSQMSIPGTHDTMSNGPGGNLAQNQSMSLRKQLDSGIRALDIRARHYGNAFPIHHGPIYLNANFTDVLRTVDAFLRDNPSEVVIMRLKEEHDAANNTRSFVETFEQGYAKTQFGTRIWGGTNPNPALGSIRGKIVILDNFPGSSSYANLQYGDFNAQDDYAFSDRWDQYNKWAGNSGEG